MDGVRFGWQGIEISVPPEWELNAFRGNHRAGFVSLDDGIATRLRMRWESAERRYADAGTAVETYLGALRKRLGRRVSLELIGPEFIPKRFREEHAVSVFRWRAEQTAWGMAWRCSKQQRMGLAEVLFQADAEEQTTPQDARTLARRVLGSVIDHRGDARMLWAAYGFAFETPERFRLQRADLVPGRLRFLFQGDRRASLRVERWAAASHWMKGAPLARIPGEWIKASQLPLRGSLQQEAFAVRNHEAIRFSCAVRGAVLRSVRLVGIVWLCVPEDRLYVAVAADTAESELDSLVDAVRCM